MAGDSPHHEGRLNADGRRDGPYGGPSLCTLKCALVG
jgi:hypothetical protein